MARHIVLLRPRRRIPSRRMMMRAMWQAAHAIAIRHARIHSTRQQSQRRRQQRENHENGLDPAHRPKFYHSRSRATRTRVSQGRGAACCAPACRCVSPDRSSSLICASRVHFGVRRLADPSAPIASGQKGRRTVWLEACLACLPSHSDARTVLTHDLRPEKHRGTLAISCSRSN
jgi:hypothetical protein